MINQDFFAALDELERQKGISKDEFISALENALSIAYKKNSAVGGTVEVKINAEKKSIKVYSVRAIVEEVVDAVHERSLWSYDHHVNAFFQGSLLYALEVGYAHVDVLAAIRCSRIAWSDVQFLNFWTLCYFPSDGVLTSS